LDHSSATVGGRMSEPLGSTRGCGSREGLPFGRMVRSGMDSRGGGWAGQHGTHWKAAERSVLVMNFRKG
jgi:hypothetical protein